LAHFRSSGVEVATYFATPLMNVANGSMSRSSYHDSTESRRVQREEPHAVRTVVAAHVRAHVGLGEP
jgi:hypothetical protein